MNKKIALVIIIICKLKINSLSKFRMGIVGIINNSYSMQIHYNQIVISLFLVY